MSLETRVETLEHEFKILKNEIERTLLEIQNQVLVHYYPTLRAEDAAPPKDLLPLLESAFTEAEEETAEPGMNRPAEEAATAPPPKTKEVSLTEIKQKPKKISSLPTREPSSVKPEIAPAKGTATPVKVQESPWPEETIEQALLPPLAKWVNESVEKIGKELTQTMLESSADADAISPEIMGLLFQFITLCDEEQPPEAVTTKELMDVLLKLDKMLGQVAKLLEGATHGDEEHNG